MKTPIAITVVCLAIRLVSAQGLEPSGTMPYVLSSGSRANAGAGISPVWSTLVSLSGATSLQLVFADVSLGSDEDAVVIRSQADGAEQRMTRERLADWRGHSAWFNGESVLLTLELAAGSSGFVQLGEVAYLGQPSGTDTICGFSDDRVPSGDARVCRVAATPTGTCTFPAVCAATAFLIGPSSTVLSARHVWVAGVFLIAEFRVPASTAAGALTRSDPRDQYPIDSASMVMSAASVVGDDWIVARLAPNALGETAVARQGVGFNVAAAPPPNPGIFGGAHTVTVIGHGSDNTPTPTWHQIQQTASGFMNGVAGTTIIHEVDTENGNSGSPILYNGDVIGIHTNGGCGVVLGSNAGTSIANAGLRAAIAAVSGCTEVTLQDGVTHWIPCTPTMINVAPPNAWSVVAVSSPADWEVVVSGALSNVAPAGGCDFVVGDSISAGAPALPPSSGVAFRAAGAVPGHVSYARGQTVNVGDSNVIAWPGPKIVHCAQFFVSQAGGYDVVVNGDPSLGWRLYQPSPGWHPMMDPATLVVSGSTTAGGAGNVLLGTGWHALVIYRSGGAGAVGLPATAFRIGRSTNTLNLALDAPTAVAGDSGAFRIQPSQAWNVVALAPATGDWDLYLGTGQSRRGVNLTDFVAVDARGGAVAALGHVERRSGSPVTMEHRASTPLALGVPRAGTVAAGSLMRAFHFDGSWTQGVLRVEVLGDPSLRWAVIPWKANWTRRNDAWFEKPAGTSGIVLSGRLAVVVFREGTPAAVDAPFLVSVCSANSAPVALSQMQPVTLNPSTCGGFRVTPVDSAWNVVGISSTGPWGIGIANALSLAASRNYVAADGHAGTIPSPSFGAAYPAGSQAAASIDQAGNHVVTVGNTVILDWTASDVVRLVEFQVTVPGVYDIDVAGPGFLEWDLLAPGASVSWRPRSAAAIQGQAVPSQRGIGLVPGWYAVVVTEAGGSTGTGAVSVRVAASANAAALGALAPASAVAGSAGLVLSAQGSGFSPSSVIRWNGADLPTTFVSSVELQATVASSLLAAPGTAMVAVWKPEAQALSNPRSFAVLDPAPQVTHWSPQSAPAGSETVPVAFTGSGFDAQTAVTWNGTALPIASVAPAMLVALVDAALLAHKGNAILRILDSVSGAAAGPFVFAVLGGPATIEAIDPPTLPAGSPSSTIIVRGTGFTPATLIHAGGAALPTTFVDPEELQTALPASLLTAPGIMAITASDPAASASEPVPFEVLAPRITLLVPPSIAVQEPGAPQIDVQVHGTGFLPGAAVYANGILLVTTQVDGTQLEARLDASVAQVFVPGGIAFTVQNAPGARLAVSNSVALVVGSGSNRGTIRRQPLAPAPGEAYAGVIEGATPFAALTLVVDIGNFAPLAPWPSAAANLVLAVSPPSLNPGSTFMVLDGIGIYGAPDQTALDASGTLTLDGLRVPNPPLAVISAIQAAFLDPAEPLGFCLTWARWPELR